MEKQLINTVSERGIWRNTLIYFGALVLNIVLGWVLAKLNTSYLSVEAYGRYSFFLIVLFMSRSFFGFGLYESVSRRLALTEDEGRRRQLIGTTLIWSLAFYALYTVFLFAAALFSDQIFEVHIGDLLIRYAGFAGFVLIHTFLLLALRGAGRMILMAEATIYPRVFYLILLIPVILEEAFTLPMTLLVLFIGYAITVLLTIIRLRPVFRDALRNTRELLAEVREYGIHMYVGAIWHELLFHADKLVISFYMDERSIAYYALAYMLTFPLSHFSNALATNLFNKFSRADRIGRRVILINFLFVSFSVLLFILLRDEIILRLFSERYLPSVALITPLALAFGLSGLSKPFTLFLMARGMGKVIRNISVAVPVVQILITMVVVPEYGIYGAAWCTFSVYLLDLLLNFIAYRRLRGTQPEV